MGEIISLDRRRRERQGSPQTGRHVHVYADVDGMQVAVIAEGRGGDVTLHVALVAPQPIGESIVASFPGDTAGSEQAEGLADVVLHVLEVVDASYRSGGGAA